MCQTEATNTKDSTVKTTIMEVLTAFQKLFCVQIFHVKNPRKEKHFWRVSIYSVIRIYHTLSQETKIYLSYHIKKLKLDKVKIIPLL